MYSFNGLCTRMNCVTKTTDIHVTLEEESKILNARYHQNYRSTEYNERCTLYILICTYYYNISTASWKKYFI